MRGRVNLSRILSQEVKTDEVPLSIRQNNETVNQNEFVCIYVSAAIQDVTVSQYITQRPGRSVRTPGEMLNGNASVLKF